MADAIQSSAAKLGEPIDRRAIPPHAAESTWMAQDGHSIRRIDWSALDANPQRGSILFFPGRGDNYEKYLETLEEWHRDGWRVTAGDWRGQAGSGRLGDDPITGHISDFSVWLDDLEAIWSAWVKETPGPHILAAHSMGGHLIARAMVEKRVDPDAAILIAPMLRMVGPRLPLNVLHGAAKVMLQLGSPKRPAWKWSEKPGELPKHRKLLLTHDDDRYADEIFWRDTRSQLVMGPGSWGWVERAYASIAVIEASGVMEAVKTPIFIASTFNDKLVSHKSCLKAAERFPNSELLTFGFEARHEILREVDEVRGKLRDAIREFLDRVAPIRSNSEVS
jgi:lysophospholipase